MRVTHKAVKMQTERVTEDLPRLNNDRRENN